MFTRIALLHRILYEYAFSSKLPRIRLFLENSGEEVKGKWVDAAEVQEYDGVPTPPAHETKTVPLELRQQLLFRQERKPIE